MDSVSACGKGDVNICRHVSSIDRLFDNMYLMTLTCMLYVIQLGLVVQLFTGKLA